MDSSPEDSNSGSGDGICSSSPVGRSEDGLQGEDEVECGLQEECLHGFSAEPNDCPSSGGSGGLGC